MASTQSNPATVCLQRLRPNKENTGRTWRVTRTILQISDGRSCGSARFPQRSECSGGEFSVTTSRVGVGPISIADTLTLSVHAAHAGARDETTFRALTECYARCFWVRLRELAHWCKALWPRTHGLMGISTTGGQNMCRK